MTSIVTEKPSFKLSDTLRALGHTLTENQALMLDIAQKLHPNFMKGAALKTKLVRRIACSYHGIRHADSWQAIQELADLGLIAFVEPADKRVEMKLLLKIQGPTEAQVEETGIAIGRLVEPKAPPKSLRERCHDKEFARDLMKRCGYAGEDSIAMRMIMAVMHAKARVDQIELAKLLNNCVAAGMTEQEFYVGCGELNALDLLHFIQYGKNGFLARMNTPVEKAEWLDAADAMAALTRDAA